MVVSLNAIRCSTYVHTTHCLAALYCEQKNITSLHPNNMNESTIFRLMDATRLSLAIQLHCCMTPLSSDPCSFLDAGQAVVARERTGWMVGYDIIFHMRPLRLSNTTANKDINNRFLSVKCEDDIEPHFVAHNNFLLLIKTQLNQSCPTTKHLPASLTWTRPQAPFRAASAR